MKSLAWMFPGQGAQSAGMGRDLFDRSSEARDMFHRAGEILGFDLARACFEGPEAELTRSDRAQPAIFTVSAAFAAAFRSARPELAWAVASGLSSGEWAALYVGEAIRFEDAVRVLQARGRFMQRACEENPGGMTSVIGVSANALEEICARSGAEIANFNSPEQTVLSGRLDALEAAERLAAEAGARRVIRLNVAGAFHSSLMKPAADQLAVLLKDVIFHPTSIPVLSNVTGRPHGGPEDIRQAMVRQVTGSVRWVECVRHMTGMGVGRMVECGPGRALTGLAKRIDKTAELHTISDLPSLDAAVGAL